MLRQRALSAAVLVPPLVVVLLLGEPWIALLVALLVAGAAFETFRLLRATGSSVLTGLGVVLAIGLAAAFAVDALPAAVPEAVAPVLLALAVVLAAVGAMNRPDPRDGFGTWIATTFGALYAALLGFVAALGAAGPAPAAGAPLAPLGAGRGWILALVLVVWTFDTAAYVVGSRIGGPRFLQHISPSKTWAGFVGGLVGSTIVGAVLVAALGHGWPAGAGLGAFVGLAAQAGDLAESMLKRAAGVKDSGTLIPGHGGLLDRVDSFLFAAPVATLYVLAVFR
ncbi:MAG TPA: phosphatidate cytidylyltransferase [Candidatus Limnocylindrales bacterium]|nr:phosphatidate cytidylyltransferase [Candidatus Limnocylindrales bacterium]